jgi:hypothetical protein
MKRIIPILSLSVLFAACNSSVASDKDAAGVGPVAEQASALKPDTSGFAQFQQWKAQQEMAAVKTIEEPVVQYAAAAPVQKARKVYKTPVYKEPVSSSTTGTSASEQIPGRSEDVTMNSESANTAEAPEKKGWSKAAKGAVIGGATGAAAGAVINKKNRAAGAVIGGVLGAGGGYVIGRGIDKKDGRY